MRLPMTICNNYENPNAPRLDGASERWDEYGAVVFAAVPDSNVVGSFCLAESILNLLKPHAAQWLNAEPDALSAIRFRIMQMLPPESSVQFCLQSEAGDFLCGLWNGGGAYLTKNESVRAIHEHAAEEPRLCQILADEAQIFRLTRGTLSRQENMILCTAGMVEAMQQSPLALQGSLQRLTSWTNVYSAGQMNRVMMLALQNVFSAYTESGMGIAVQQYFQSPAMSSSALRAAIPEELLKHEKEKTE